MWPRAVSNFVYDIVKAEIQFNGVEILSLTIKLTIFIRKLKRLGHLVNLIRNIRT